MGKLENKKIHCKAKNEIVFLEVWNGKIVNMGRVVGKQRWYVLGIFWLQKVWENVEELE